MTDRTPLAPAAERREQLDARFRPWKSMTIAQALDAAVAAFPDRPLFITDTRSYTYRAMQDWSRQLAYGLVDQGVRPGDHVAMVVANYPEFVAAKFAIARAGAVCIPINYLFRAAELGYVLNQSDAKVLITMDRYRDLDYLTALDELSPGWEQRGGGEAVPELRAVVVFSPTGESRHGAMALEELALTRTESARADLTLRETTTDPTSYSDILYTSGTTGRPKGVLLTHEQIVRMAYGAAYQRALEDGRRLSFPLPMYHVFGYVEALMAVLFVGGAVVPQVAFDAKELLADVDRHRVNEIIAVPAVTMPLLAEARTGNYDLSSVHTVFSSGGAVPESFWDEIREVFGPVAITTGYGMTETTAATACAMPEGDIRLLRTTLGRIREAGAAGDPELDGRLAVYKTVDVVSGEELPPGEAGHLLVRGPVVTHGYYKKPEETAQAFTDDGWLRTGDIGTVDADGYLRLRGRLKESLRVGGEMVMPAEIEAVLGEHPGVLQAHVVGIPHVRLGEVACAWIVPTDPDNPPEPDELIEHCSGRLARFKVPRQFILTTLDELPVTPTGKIQKFRLSEMSQDRLSTQQPVP
jgi:fatty-acyl-CoA synthase